MDAGVLCSSSFAWPGYADSQIVLMYSLLAEASINFEQGMFLSL